MKKGAAPRNEIVPQPAHRAPQLKEISTKLIDHAPHNPKSRVIGDKVGQLASAIADIGLKYPILVRPVGQRFEISDGHRRLAAYKRLGWATIPAFVLGASEDPNRIYSRINSSQQKFTGNQLLEVYLTNAEAVTERAHRKFFSAEKQIGRARLEKICRSGFSLNLYGLGQRVAKYLGRPKDDDEFMCQVTDWLIKFRLHHLIRSLMITESDPNIIERAISQMKPIKMKPILASRA